MYLQVTETGGRSWIFRYMIHKRSREMGLGSADNWDLTTVRQRATELRQMLDQGIDPIEQRNQERRQQQAALASIQTFSQCAEKYHELNAEGWKNAKHAAQFINTLKTYIYPVCGDWPIGEVTEVQVLKAIEPIWKTKHETATRVLQRVKKVLTWAAAARYRDPIPEGFWEHVHSKLPKVEVKDQHHEACPYIEAGATLLRVRDSAATDIVKLAFTFTVLTAARSGETRGAAWSEIDWENKVWTVPAERMKAGRMHRVPLSDSALAVLKAAQRLAGTSPLIFPSVRKVKLSDMVFTQLLRRLDTGYTMHGFRSTFRDWTAEQTNYPRQVCEAALAHTIEDKTEAAYLRSDFFNKRRDLMSEWARYLEAKASENPR